MNIFKVIGDFFKNAFFPKFKDFLKSVFTSAVSVAMAEVQDTVTKVVKDLSSSDLSTADKREEAYKRVVETLKSSGKEASESIIRSTIELAVLSLKNSQSGVK